MVKKSLPLTVFNMKVLLIVAQDIKKISLAWVEEGVVHFQKNVFVEPDFYLLTLRNFLEEAGHDLNELQAIAAVTGPGSFTASRVSLTMANALAFALEIKIAGLTNEARQVPDELAKKYDFDQLAFQVPPLVPAYDREPHITVPKK